MIFCRLVVPFLVVNCAIAPASSAGVIKTTNPKNAVAGPKDVAPNTPITPALTWSDCLSRTIQNNAELRQAKESLTSSEALKNASRGTFFPSISGTMGYSYGSASNGSGSGGGGTSTSSGFISTDSASSAYSASLLLSQNLFNGFEDQAKLKQSTANEDISRSSLRTTTARVSQELKTAFQGLKYAEDSVKLSGEIVDRRTRNLQLVQLRFENGRENKGSLLLSKAYLKDAELGRLQAEDLVNSSSTSLASVLGLDKAQRLSVTGDVPIQAPPVNPDFETLVLTTPDHSIALGQAASSVAGVSLAEGAFYPSLNVAASTGWSDTQFFPNNNRWSVGLNLTIPLFSGLKDYYSVKSARALSVASSYSLNNVDRTTLTKLKQVYSNFLEAIKKEEVDVAYAQAARVRSEIARGQYNNGLLAFDNWDIIENDLISRERAALGSRRDRITAEANWEQALGQGAF